MPHSHVEELGDIDFQIKIVKLAERENLDAIFLGDGQHISEESTSQISCYFEPMIALAAIARETEHIVLFMTLS